MIAQIKFNSLFNLLDIIARWMQRSEPKDGYYRLFAFETASLVFSAC